MYIAERLRRFREAKQLSQGDIEKRSGLLRCYISRVENGMTVPSVETLEKLTRALEIPLYQLFLLDDEQALDLTHHPNGARDWSSTRSGVKYIGRLLHSLARLSERDLDLLLHTANHMVRSHNHQNG